MADPVGVTVATTAAQQAPEKAFGFLNRAAQYAADDARACSAYLDAAYQAIIALESEYDRLLVEAKRCDLESEDEIRSVVRQIDEYLTIETRRSALQRAVAGLRQCRESLEGFADRFLQTPSKRVNRRDTLLTLRSLIRDFEAFLDALESKSTRSDEMELSGVGVVSLLQIRRFLEGARDRGRLLGGEVDDDHTVLVRIINEAQRNRDKNRYLKQIADLETVTRRLIQDFR